MISFTIYGQKSIKVDKIIILQDSEIILDSLSIINHTFKLLIDDTTINNGYILDPNTTKLIITNKSLIGKEAHISYITFPISFNEKYYHKSIDSLNIIPDKEKNPFLYVFNQNNNQNINIYGLNKSGSISRGIVIGNNQDLGLNSNFNLQLNGKLSEDVNITASISDQNIPIQPEGNTQQLQDFDRIFINVYNNNFSIIAGDYDFKNYQENYFLKYQKRLKGGQVELNIPANTFDDNLNGKIKIYGNGSISKGKFARDIFNGIEGNQGPYKLSAQNSQKFIQILSGTERIFIDGVLLKRGQTNDYTINYNTGELTFTSRRLITKDTRISAEFQYSDQNYVRTNFTLGGAYESEKTKIYFSYYNEKDNKNQPLQQDLSDSTKRLLSELDGSSNEIFINSADSTSFSNDAVLYRVDTVNGYFPVYINTYNDDSTVYNVSFNEVGLGNGNYILKSFDANGRIYEWITPLVVGSDTILQGSYAPINVIYAPEKETMFVLGVEHKISEKNLLKIEFANSTKYNNTFSDINTNGNAIFVKSENDIQLENNKLFINYSLETVSKNFNSIERFRSAEFYRDWNINNDSIKNDQFINEISFGIKDQQKNFISLTSKNYYISNQYNGNQAALKWSLKNRLLNSFINASYTNSSGIKNTSFARSKGKHFIKIQNFNIGYEDEFEWNELKSADTINFNSYRFYRGGIFINQKTKNNNFYELKYSSRIDWKPFQNEFFRTAISEDFNAEVRLMKNRNNTLSALFGYRKLNVTDKGINLFTPENTIVSRLDHRLQFLKRTFSFQTFYETGSGLERKKEYYYQEVQPGQGNYVWIDYNDNNIKELDEFEKDNFSGLANYVRLSNLTDEYIKTYAVQLSETFIFRPSNAFKNKNNVTRIISLFSNQLNFQINRKTTNENNIDRFNPFIKNIEDSSLVSFAQNLRNTVYFNRTNPKFGLNYIYQNSERKTTLTGGIDFSTLKNHIIDARWNIYKDFSVLMIFNKSNKTNFSDYTQGKNYNIDEIGIKPVLQYQPNTIFRLQILSRLTIKENIENINGEISTIQSIGISTKYSQLKKGSLQATLEYIYNTYNGGESNSLSFEMLESLSVGKNYTINLSYQKTLGKNIQLNFSYNGRVTNNNQVTHVGSAQVRAFF